ncbi:hypothetical protein ACOMHN_029425 [Nucella lapillus]
MCDEVLCGEERCGSVCDEVMCGEVRCGSVCDEVLYGEERCGSVCDEVLCGEERCGSVCDEVLCGSVCDKVLCGEERCASVCDEVMCGEERCGSVCDEVLCVSVCDEVLCGEVRYGSVCDEVLCGEERCGSVCDEVLCGEVRCGSVCDEVLCGEVRCGSVCDEVLCGEVRCGSVCDEVLCGEVRCESVCDEVLCGEVRYGSVCDEVLCGEERCGSVCDEVLCGEVRCGSVCDEVLCGEVRCGSVCDEVLCGEVRCGSVCDEVLCGEVRCGSVCDEVLCGEVRCGSVCDEVLCGEVRCGSVCDEVLCGEVRCGSVCDEVLCGDQRRGEEQKEGPQALILAPTRELALQVCKHIRAAARHTDIQVVSVVGGMAPQKQFRLLKRHPQIVVATPGRLWELIEEGQEFLQKLGEVDQFVLDEADRMIEKGHFEELHKIISLISSTQKRRQHYIFSATLMLDHAGPHRPVKKKRKKEARDPKQKLEELAQELGIQEKPKVIDLTHKEVTVDTLTETRINCPITEKDLYLYYILRKYRGRTLVFCNSKDCIRRLVSVFSLLHCSPLPLHSDMHQRQRLKNLDRFVERETGVLLASDVAARGLDIKGVDHVVHYQVPFTIENYVHRSGRTARACREGVSVVLVSPDETSNYRSIVKLKQGQDLPLFPVDSDVLRTLKTHVALARKIDIEQHRLRKEEVNSNWMQKAAAEMDIELDDDLLPQEEEGERQQLKQKLKQQKLQLADFLKQPVLPAVFSGRYPTKAGHLVEPKSFTKGSAVNDCKPTVKAAKKDSKTSKQR